RAVVLGGLSAGLLAVVIFKVVTRVVREFNDRALALVLERRYPKLLGDRLITAIELADPQMAKRYRYSQAMVDYNVQDAANRVDQVPVGPVFNWRRLILHGVLVASLTVGLYLIVGIAYCVFNLRSPIDYMVRFHHVACIWAERNLLLMHSYWPRQAHLE